MISRHGEEVNQAHPSALTHKRLLLLRARLQRAHLKEEKRPPVSIKSKMPLPSVALKARVISKKELSILDLLPPGRLITSLSPVTYSNPKLHSLNPSLSQQEHGTPEAKRQILNLFSKVEPVRLIRSHLTCSLPNQPYNREIYTREAPSANPQLLGRVSRLLSAGRNLQEYQTPKPTRISKQRDALS